MKLVRNLAPIIVSSMLSIALSTLLLEAQLLDTPLWLTLSLCICFSFILCVLMTYRKAGLAFIILLITGGMLFWRYAGDDLKAPVIQFVSESYNYIFGSVAIPLTYPRLVAGLHIFAVSLICSLLTVLLPNLIIISLLSFAYLFLEWLIGYEVMLQAALIAAALLIFYMYSFERKTAKARHEKPSGKLPIWTIPVCLSIITASYLFVKLGDMSQNWKWFSTNINLINDYLYDYTGFDSPRAQFSISSVGFQPLGNRLGGPLELKDTPILSVDSRYRVLLRGNIKNDYTGTKWVNTAESDRYRLNNNSYAETRIDVFDLERPDPELFGDLLRYFYTDMEISITNLQSTGTTIFTPFRVNNVKPAKAFTILPFYNDEGEVFSSRSISAGISYVVYSPYINPESNRFPEFMANIEAGAPPESPEKEALLEQYYMGLPENLPDTVYQTTISVISGIEGDYSKALAIEKYLQDNFTYTTQPEAVPEGVDFVAYFLETREGYCTYYASAMAIMARAAGLPSRYVEGFKADGNRRGEPQVLEMRDAHAWAEIYFDGFGWVPFDAVPNSDLEFGGGQPETEGIPEDLFQFETPSPDMQTDIEYTPVTGVRRYIWILCILAVIIAGAVALGIFAAAKNSLLILKRRSGGDMRKIAAHYYLETIWLLDYYNRSRKPGETLTEYGKHTDEWLKLKCGKFSKMAAIISMMVYAGKVPVIDEIKWMALFRRQLAVRTLKSAGLPRFFYRQAVLMRHISKPKD